MFLSERQQAIARSLQKVCKRTAFGGDCYNYVSLATGWGAMPLVVLEADLQYYDFCALIPILAGVGAWITDWQGKPLTAESREVIATSNRALLEQVLEVIKLSENFLGE
jgi:fructose-1,6-bisphosphatase/inositol monophosphatase family enzyme